MAKRTELKLTVDMKALRRIIKETPGKVEDFMDAEAEDVVNDVVQSFGVSPSAPGEPPGVVTNALRGGMRWERQGRFTRWIMDSVDYGLHLEWGTENMAPRPFMSPAFERKRKNFASHAQAWGIVI